MLKSKFILNPMLLCDFYKISHIDQYQPGTEYTYSTWTPRTSRLEDVDYCVWLGAQKVIIEYLIHYFNENFFSRPEQEVVDDYKRVIRNTLAQQDVRYDHISKLHKLGYLPIKIKALPEGTKVPLRVPTLTIENTHKDFYWLTTYLESFMSAELWQMSTSATIAYKYRKLLDMYAEKTSSIPEFVDFQAHDFSFRGMGGIGSGVSSGLGHLLSFMGTDTLPSILAAEHFYGGDIEKELIGTSIPATEHSVMCVGGEEGESDTYKRLLTETYPSGFVSIVSDTWDLWSVIKTIIGEDLKETIMKRDGKTVIRPDSGDPVDIVCGTLMVHDKTGASSIHEAVREFTEQVEGRAKEKALAVYNDRPTYEGNRCKFVKDYMEHFRYGGKTYKIKYSTSIVVIDGKIDSVSLIPSEHVEVKVSPEEIGVVGLLWEIFGGTINSKGYKELDSHIGVIYGDAITYERAEAICTKLEMQGFASTNIVFGVGSFTYQYNTRDTLGFALKATHAVVNGEERNIIKNPKTDDGTKVSNTGRVAVVEEDGNLKCVDGLSKDTEYPGDLLRTIFKDGELLVEDTFATIRERLKKQ